MIGDPRATDGAARAAVRPPLLRPSLAALTWHLSTSWAAALLVVAAFELPPATWRSMGAPMAAILVLVLVSELRPFVTGRTEPLSVSPAFVFAAMFVWGPGPALIIQALAVAISEMLHRRPAWRLAFNVGQYVLSTAAAGAMIHLLGGAASPATPTTQFSVRDLGVVLAAATVFHVVNLALVAGMSSAAGVGFWESFTEDFWFHTSSTFAVLALSPMVAVTAVAGSESWTLMPLLLVPLVAVQRAERMSRDGEHHALHDLLTGLPNRVLLTDRLRSALDRAGRRDGSVAVIFLDLDGFRVVNDGLGHAAGDALLVEVAGRLSRAIPRGDTVARFGGDEFAILCEALSSTDVTAITGRIRDSLVVPFHHDGHEVTITASLGVALAGPHSTPQTMLREADAAMFRAKAAGRDQVIHYQRAMQEQAVTRLDEQVHLRRAIERGELRAHYQPVIDLETGRTGGFEALVRWQHPERGLLGPDRFIPLAEDTGLIVPLGTWILEAALEQLQAWRSRCDGAGGLWVGVNLSARQLRDPCLVDRIAKALHRTAVPAACLHLEITETVVMDFLDVTMDTLERLRALGVRLVVDDFGTGYSSLSYLKRLPVTTLKIDRSFVSGLGQEASDLSIVDAIVNLARSLNLGIIAEGVETVDQARILRHLGAHAAQGYLWSRPLPAAEVEPWIGAVSGAGVPDYVRAVAS